MDRSIIIAFLIFCACSILISRVILSVWRKWKTPRMVTDQPGVMVFGRYSPVFSSISVFIYHLPEHLTRFYQSTAFEVCILVCWALFIGRSYLNFDPTVVPKGTEFGMAIQGNFTWKNLFECGACFFWNGSVQGGAPSFADQYSSWLHPLVAIPAILLGVVNGSKVTLLLSFISAGLAQLWLGRILKIGRLPRIWVGMLAVCGGHLSTRMELGTTGLVITTAACSLVIPPLLDLVQNPSRRKAVILGIILGLALISGQGYILVGLLTCVFPAVIVFFTFDKIQNRLLAKEIAISIGLALLLAALFLVPLIHIFPNIHKEDSQSFNSAQPAQYLPLNLVISDIKYYYSDSLQKIAYPFTTGNYLGWIPIGFAVLSIKKFNRKNLSLLFFFIVALGLIFLTASSTTLKLAAIFFPELYAIRFPQLIASLAGPLILALTGIGLEYFLSLDLPTFELGWKDQPDLPSYHLSTMVVILVILLPLSLKNLYSYSENWLATIKIDASVYEDVKYLITPTTEWVDTPYAIHVWYIPALENGLKLSNAIRPWMWNARANPSTTKYISFDDVSPDTPFLEKQINGTSFFFNPANQYAYLQNGNQFTACDGNARGGFIDITCPDSDGGILTVYENTWSGWRAWVDEQPSQLLGGQWLSVKLDPGPHTIRFRYQPWDVWLGIGLSALGILLCLLLWKNAKDDSLMSPESCPPSAEA